MWIVAVALVACSEQPSKLDELATKKPPPAAPEAPLAFDAKAIDAWVGAELARRGIVGAALVIVRDGKTELARGYGKRRIDAPEPVDADTPFALGSLSKQFACTAAYQLVDRGMLSMAEPVATYYPQLTRAAEVTLADLGGHTSGYRDYYPLDYVDTRMASPIAPDDLIARYAMLPLDFAPGTRLSYSNTGFVILARVIEKVTRKPYADVLAEQIFQPIGMRASLARPANAASGHVAFLLGPPAPAPLEAAGWLFGAADIWASATELAKWDLAIADGKLLSPASQRALMTARSFVSGRSSGYSCGFYIRITNGLTVLQHSGWVGGFHTHNAIAPLTRSAVVLLTNDEHARATDLFDRIVRLTTEDTSAVPQIAGPPAEDVLRDLLHQLQRGTLDRGRLGDDANAYFDAARVAASAASLRALGEPTIHLDSRRERGGGELSFFTVKWPSKTADAVLFRSPDGKVHQLLF